MKFSNLYQEFNTKELSRISSPIIERTYSERVNETGTEDTLAKLDSVKKRNGKVQASFVTPSTKGDKVYAMTIQFLDTDKLSRWNFGRKDIKVNCTCPHFHWGGLKYGLGKIDSSIRTTSIPDSYWSGKHGGPSVCKHILGLLKNIKHFKKPIIKQLRLIK